MKEGTITLPGLDDIYAAAKRLVPYNVRTPLVPLETADASKQIFLKLENLQHIGVFKVRCMGNILLSTAPETLENGVYTASSGNAGIGLAWMARELGIAARVYIPRSGPQSKLERMRRYGATIEVLDDDDWWQIILRAGHDADPGFYVDAVRSPVALAGNGTMAMEILEQLPSVENVVVPFGGGGVACGIGNMLKALKSSIRLIVAECETAAPVAAALDAGKPVNVETRPSFISGAGAPCVLAEMWPLVNELVEKSVVISQDQVADAIRLIFKERHVAAEGAGGLALAGALADAGIKGKTVCLVSGGNIDAAMMTTILAGATPG